MIQAKVFTVDVQPVKFGFREVFPDFSGENLVFYFLFEIFKENKEALMQKKSAFL